MHYRPGAVDRPYAMGHNPGILCSKTASQRFGLRDLNLGNEVSLLRRDLPFASPAGYDTFMAVFYGWWVVLACFVVGFYIAGSTFYGFTAFVEPLVAEFGWSFAQVSFAASLRGLEMGIFAPLVGVFTDRFGSRVIMFIGVVIIGLSMILLGQTHSLMTFYAASLLLGLGAGGCTSVVIMTTVAHWFNRRASLALGLAASGFGSGGLMVPAIVWMIESYGWRSTFLVLGLAAWVVGVPLSFVIRSSPEKYGVLPDGEDPGHSTGEPATGKERTRITPGPESITLKVAIREGNFWYFNAAEAIRMLVVVSIMIHIMPYLNSIGIPSATAGMATAALAIFNVAGRIGFGYLGDRSDKRHIMAASYGLMALGLIVFTSHIEGFWTLFLFLVLLGPGIGGGMTMRASLLREYFGTASYGKILGITMGVGSVAGIIGPTLAGWVYDTFYSYSPLWFSYISLTLIAILLILSIRPFDRASVP